MRLPRLKLSVRASVTCQLCGRKSPLISEALELCSDYLRSDFERARPYIEKAHFEARKPFALPAAPPHARKRPSPPFLVASLNPEIPYSLLGFHPQFFMSDLPTTARHIAYECLEAAKQAGLRNVRIGNLHLLQDYRAGLATFKDSESGNS
jgi:hypothetical protein